MSTILRDDDLVLEPTSGSDGLHGWALTIDGDRLGTIALLDEGRGVGSVRWNTGTGDGALGLAVRALRLVLEHAFGERGLLRVEARVPVDRTEDVRAASISGLRREGIARGAGDAPDRALLARLHDDPPATSRDGFIALLNAGLPTKRVISQGLLRDPQGRVLLCRLTYKQEWDLPGGVVEVGESPADGLVRELEEELGLTVQVRELLTVNWLPAWRGWDDACIFLFDLGVVDTSYVDDMVLQPTEIVSVHWCDSETVHDKATAAAIELLDAVAGDDLATYREAPLAPTEPPTV
ncbi:MULTISPECIES: NUDIX hydrolase [unclassified Aeromicrobium]|uniref:NUDIX hydrolase n=1 Tax=unclassified Aeromicrobium TaxID=2633570 RepID=UPI00288AE7DD|nr:MULTISPECIES: NUDIX hydrolase [unclassified Aeromicrobium]